MINIVLGVVKIPKRLPEVPLQANITLVLATHAKEQSSPEEIRTCLDTLQQIQEQLGVIEDQLDARLQTRE